MIAPLLRFKDYSTEWSSAPLGNITNYVDYRGKTPEKCDSGIFLVTAKNIRQGYIDYNISKEYIASSEYNAVMRRGIPEIGDVLITTEAPLGYVASVDRTNIALAQRVIKFRGKAGALLNGYLKYLMSSASFQKELNEKATGGTAKGIKGSILHKMLCSYPKDLQEQTKITRFLSAIDEKINQLTRKHELLEQYKNGVMQKIFGQEIRFKDDQCGEFPEWEQTTIGEVSELKNGYIFKSTSYSENGKFKVITISNVQDGIMDMSKFNSVEIVPNNIRPHQVLNIGDILVSMTGNVGRVCKVNTKNCLLNQRVGKLVPKKINIDYLYFLLTYSKFIHEMELVSQGGAQKNIGSTDIEGYEVDVPSIPEQIKISKFLSGLDKKITNTKSQLEATKEYKQGLLQQMFV